MRAELESVRRENAHLLSLTNQRAAAATSDDDERDRKLAILHDQNSTNPTKFLYPSCRGEAISNTAIRPSVCSSSYRYAGCLQLSRVRTADPSADGRRALKNVPGGTDVLGK